MDPITSIRSESVDGSSGRKPGFIHRLPDPTSRKDIEYYRDPAHRGYLSYTVEEGQGPSLFFKKPGTGKPARRNIVGSKAVAGENRIW